MTLSDDFFRTDGPVVVRAPLDHTIVIRNLDEWRKRAPPKGGDRHWVDGRSAKEVAKAWCRPDGTTAVPADLLALLRSHDLTRNLVVATAIPEKRTPLAGERGGPRHHDLLLFGLSDGRRVVVGVEAKTDEPFDEPLRDRIDTAKKILARGEATGQLDRIKRLSAAIFGRPAVTESGQVDGMLGPLPYQLLAGVAGTLIEAEKHGADPAVLAIHAFHSSELDSDAIKRNKRDFGAFVHALPGGDGVSVVTGELAGPFEVVGGKGVPAGELLIGMTTTQLGSRSTSGA